MSKIQIFFLTSSMFFSACNTSSLLTSKDSFYHNGIYFGQNLEVNVKKGIMEGCTTSKGVYTKSHTLFNNDNGYYNGWFLGRRKCKELLEIDKNGE